MNPLCNMMSHAKRILLLQHVRSVQNESILQHDESCKMHFALAKCDVHAKSSILQCDESCKIHFALAKCEVRAKSSILQCDESCKMHFASAKCEVHAM